MVEANKEVHSVFDSASLIRQAQMAKEEEKKANELASYLAKMCQARVVDVNKWNDSEHQAGHRLLAPIFESKVKKLVPSIIFITRPLTDSQCRFCNLAEGSSIKSMELLEPDGKSKPIAGYQNHPIIPEYTVILQRPVVVQNPLIHHADSADFPKAHKVKDEKGPWEGGYTWKYEGPTPYETKSYEEAGTIVGWRTLLARLVLNRLATPFQIEKEFGISDKESWAVRMGRRNFESPVTI